MSAISLHMSLCVRGAIKNLQGSRAKRSGFTHDNGAPMTRLEAIDALMDELAKGRETIPMHRGCGNPCKNSSLCAGFDYGVQGGCPGHPVDEGEKT